MKAAQMGISESVSGYISQIDEAAKHTHGFNMATTGARRELLVLAHEASQGNWSKFGGSLMVLGERTDALGAIMSATGVGVGLFVGAIAAAAYEIYKTTEAISALDKASAVTNGYLGLTNDQLSAMVQQLAGANGGLVETSSTMAALTRTGHASADTLAQLTTVVTQFGKDAGLSADKAAEAFVKMLDDPKKGVAELQAQYHMFSAAQVQVIDGYIKTGDTAQTTRAFIDAVAESQHRMAAQGTQEVGILAKLWQSFADAAKQAGDNFDRMGVSATNAEKLTDAVQRQAEAQRNLVRAQSMGPAFSQRAQIALDAANAQVAAIKKVQDADKKAADENAKRAKSGDTKIAVDKYLDSSKYANPQRQHALEIEQENSDFKRTTANLDKNSQDYQSVLKRHYENVAQIDEQYAKKTKQHGNNGAITSAMAQMAADNSALESQRKAALSQAKSDYDTGRRSYEDYYAQVRDLNVKFLSEEIDNAKKREDISAGKKEQTARVQAHKDWQKLIDERDKAEQDYTNAIAEFQKQRATNVQRYRDQQANVLQANADAYNHTNDTRYMNRSDTTDYTARLRVREAYYQQVEALKLTYGDDPKADQDTYQKKLTIAAQAFADQQTQLEAHLAQEKSKRDSFSDQMHLAITQLGGDGTTNAQLVATAFTSAWQLSSSALDQFITTGQGNFQQFTASILADLAKIALHAAEMQIFQSIGMSAFSTGGPVGHFATGGAIVGAGTETSDSIPAMLSNGEYVIKASQAKKYGSLLESINNGHMAHFASGGAVGAVSSSTPASGGGNPVSVVVHNNGGGGLTDTDAKELHTLVSAFVDKRMGQAMRGQGGYAYQLKYGQI